MSSGSLSFAMLVMSSAPAKSAGGARYASQDLFIQSTLSHAISTQTSFPGRLFFTPQRTRETLGTRLSRLHSVLGGVLRRVSHHKTSRMSLLKSSRVYLLPLFRNLCYLATLLPLLPVILLPVTFPLFVF